jgi:hypothetical protein
MAQPLLPAPTATPEPLPEPLAALARRAQAAERSASGSARSAAFRATRCLLGGARVRGYTVGQLAACLQVSESSIRTRAYADGWLSQRTFADLAGLDVTTVDRWHRHGHLPHGVRVHAGEMCMLASDAIYALVARPDRHAVGGRVGE